MSANADDGKLRAHIRALLQKLHDASDMSRVFAIFNAPSVPSLFTETIDDILRNTGTNNETFFPVGAAGGYWVRLVNTHDDLETCILMHRKITAKPHFHVVAEDSEYESCRKRKQPHSPNRTHQSLTGRRPCP